MTEPLTRPHGVEPDRAGPDSHQPGSARPDGHRPDSSGPDDAGRPLGRGIPLGRWAGVPVSAHWSVLLAWLLFADMLAVSVLPAARPGQSTAGYWLAGSVTALAFFGFLLAHELAHVAVARHYRMGVRSVTLWMLGGVSELRSEPPTPRADALIAAAGPATSLLLGAATFTVSTWFGPGLAAVSLAWLGGVNVVLAVFNLLPGAPLDGGRLVRAVLWWHHQDRPRAAAAAARIGRGLGIMLAILGILELLTGYPAGLWLVFLGWFITSAASAEQAAARTETLHGLPAGAVMRPLALVVPGWWTAEQFVSRLPAQAAGQPVFPLVDFDGRITGVLTLRDVSAVPVGERADRRLRELTVRRSRPVVVRPDADVAEIARLLPPSGGLAVVAEDGRPVGLITGSELARAAQLAGLNWRADG